MPLDFFDNGKCGNKANHTRRLVISGFLVDRFKKSFRRKKVLDETLKGLSSTSATFPYANKFF